LPFGRSHRKLEQNKTGDLVGDGDLKHSQESEMFAGLATMIEAIRILGIHTI